MAKQESHELQALLLKEKDGGTGDNNNQDQKDAGPSKTPEDVRKESDVQVHVLLTKDEIDQYDRKTSEETINLEIEDSGINSLGFTIIDVIIEDGSDERRLFIDTVKKGGQAAVAGLQVNDELYEIDSEEEESGRYTRPFVNYYLRNATEVSLTVRRLEEDGSWKTRVAGLIQQAREQEKKLRKPEKIKAVGEWKRRAFPNGDNRTVHIHFLDHDTSPWNREYRCEGDIADLLRDSLTCLHSITDGMLVHWGGRNEGQHPDHSIVADALTPLLKDADYRDNGFQSGDGQSVSVAVPLKQQIEREEDWCDGAPAHHVLVPSPQAKNVQFPIALMDSSVGKKKPTVCMVVNGGVEVLRLACAAMERDIPVIVLKETGGVAGLFESLAEAERCNKTALRDLIVKWMNEDTLEDRDVDRVFQLYSDRKHLCVTFWDIHQENLDAVILKSLIKIKKYERARKFIGTMLEKVKLLPEDKKANSILEEVPECLRLFQECQRGCDEESRCLLWDLMKTYIDEINFPRLLKLYESQIESKDKKWEKYMKVRDKLFEFTNHLVATPLQCPGFKKCPKCKVGLKDEINKDPTASSGQTNGTNSQQQSQQQAATTPTTPRQTRRSSSRRRSQKQATSIPTTSATPGQSSGTNSQQQVTTTPTTSGPPVETCLPPAQEIFLLSLICNDQQLMETAFEHVEGKMAAAMFAASAYTGMAREEKDGLQKQELQKKASHLRQLASRTFQNCCRSDSHTKAKTKKLLDERYDNNWGGFTLLQIAIITGNREFMKEDATEEYLEEEWMKSQILDVETEDKDKCCQQKKFQLFPPRIAYLFSVIFQLLFLGLFSYVLLFDSLTTVSPYLITLSAYIADLLVDEIRQMGMGDPLLQSSKAKKKKMLKPLKEYFSNKWNWLDLACIITFAVSMGLIFGCPHIQDCIFAGRVLLCFDVLFFFMRFLQMLMYREEIGIFLVMAKKSVKHVGYFMVILLIVMWGYLVSTHGMMFPPPNNVTTTLTYVFDLPFKGYWQAFNNFDVASDIGVCQEVIKRDVEGGECQKDLVLATPIGHYLASVLLAVYLMFVNILMMNLLIAKFNNTFEEIDKDARVYQMWHRYNLLLEYQVHTPAPFSFLSLILAPLLRSLLWCRHRLRACSCGRKEGQNDGGQIDGSKNQQDYEALKKILNEHEKEQFETALEKEKKKEDGKEAVFRQFFERKQFQTASAALDDLEKGEMGKLQKALKGAYKEISNSLSDMEGKISDMGKDLKDTINKCSPEGTEGTSSHLQHDLKGMEKKIEDVQKELKETREELKETREGMEKNMAELQQTLQQVLTQLGQLAKPPSPQP